ncbi:unnamed protein product [Cladocopium goreaui]|uniref:Uncharacterized protein n=1 Tax=Cladocopium goreaui TaxID=2562237 RepID=A0A9P1DJ41_9DINO|nr:unnamed protein product [Cladocopium goreaui]CAI4013850.1 unnamed protein product [Cladocopium goreaui]
MTVLIDQSGHLFGKKKCSIKDLIVNKEVLLAVVKALGDRPRVSAYTLQDALLGFYTEAKLYPSGVFSEIPAVQDWALKQAIGIKKLVSRLRRLMKRSSTSKHRKLTEVKAIARRSGWCKESDERASLGDPDDLEELASSSTTTPGSSEVSLASGSTGLAGSKLERVIQQLKDIKLRWETPAPVMAPPDQTPGKMTAMNCVTVDSSDEEGLVSHEHGDPPAPASSVDSKNSTLSPSQRVAQFLLAKKNARLVAAKAAVGNPEKTPDPGSDTNPYVLPDHVSRLCIVHLLIFLISELCIYLVSLAIVHAHHKWRHKTEVLQTMGKISSPPTAFSLKSQYVQEVSKARAASGVEPSEDEEVQAAAAPGSVGVPRSAKRKRKDTKQDVKEKDTVKGDDTNSWNYNAVRSAYIKEIRERDGLSFAEAKTSWDNSDQKCEYLGSVSVSELKRRKFIAKGVSENPWAKGKFSK